MRWGWRFPAVVLGAALWVGTAQAGGDPAASAPATTPGPSPVTSVPAQAPVPLILSIREMSVSGTPFGDTGDLDKVKSTNGSGKSSWPSPNVPVARGVYFSFTPACIPGVDEPYFPGARRPSAARRR